MTTSASGSDKPREKILRRLAAGFLILGGLGFFDATYLSVMHYRGTLPACGLLGGCDAVLTSGFAMVGPVPLALLGVVYYAAVFLLAYGYIDTGQVALLRLASGLAGVGFLASLALVYLQLFVIRSLCQFCMFSAATSTLLFVLGVLVLQKDKRSVQAPDGAE
jgi:uncharacterized membrane protein